MRIYSTTIQPKHEPYLEASARLRRISVPALVRKILDAVMEGQLILATLDDEESVVKPRLQRTRKRRVLV